ncbi:MAG: DUF4912 domain-containing protein [Methyloprofundus sp.]|nr:DUF4912 domain-containing protein [Methyloprofundus sp.]
MTFWQSRYNPQLKLSQQDLIDVSEAITQAYAPVDSHMQSELVLMPVDPVTLHAYWNIKDNNSIEPGGQLILRVYSNPELSEHPQGVKLSFDIKLSSFQSQQKVSVPIAATAYSAVIGKINADSSFSILATSEVIHVPRKTPAPINSLNDPIDEPAVISSTKVYNNQLIEQKIIPENNEKSGQNIPMFDHLFVVEISNAPDIIYMQREHSTCESNSNSAQNKYTATNNATAPQAEPFILKNFNNQGYDLKVYANSCNSEFANILAMQESGFYISPKKSKTIKQNNSGLGLYL